MVSVGYTTYDKVYKGLARSSKLKFCTFLLILLYGKVLAIKSILILILTAAFHAKVHLQKAVASYYSIVHCYILWLCN